MDKIDFENLPSTNTPVSAENLNAMQSNIEKSVVAVGKTQPSTGENVWIKKGKNLFDKNKIIPGYILAQDGSIAPPNNSEASSDYIAIESSNPYTFSASNYTVPTGGSMWLAISLFDSNKNIIARYADYNISSITVTASQTVNAKYIRVSYRYNDSNIKCQLEYGSTATTYEPYVEKQILVKNQNGVFDEFYNESETNQDTYSFNEQKIGTWIDGKPLYRKVIKLNTINRGSDNTSYNISTPNLKEVIDIRGSVTTDFGAVKPLNHFYIQNGTIEPAYSCCLYSFDSSSLQLVYGSFIAERFSFANVIVEYTKTTD